MKSAFDKPKVIYLDCAFVGLLIFTLLLYYPSLGYDYLRNIDDGWLIIDNAAIKKLNFAGIYYLFFQDRLEPFYHPAMYVSLAIDYYFFGLSPFWMKLHNLCLHLGSGYLVLVLVNKLSRNAVIALITAGLFLLHPLQVENIVSASCREQVLLVFYSLGSLLAFIKYNESKTDFSSILWISVCLISFSISILSKFIAAVMVPMFALYMFLYRDNLPVNHIGNLNWRKCLLLFSPFTFIVLAVYYMNLNAAENNFLLKQFNYTAWEHVAIFLHSFGFYIKQSFFPIHLSLFYPAPVAGQVFTWSFLIVALMGALVLIMLPLLVVKKQQVAAFALGFYLFGVLLTADTMLVTKDLPATLDDRHFYMASFGLFLLTAYGLAYLMGNKTILFVGGLLLIALSARTYWQIKHWQSTETILASVVDEFPNEELYNRLALEYYRNGNMRKAYETLQKAKHLNLGIEVNNPYFFRLDLAALYMLMGDTISAERELDKAIKADIEFESNHKECLDVSNNYIYKAPFSVENYTNYTHLRKEIISKCGARMKKGRL